VSGKSPALTRAAVECFDRSEVVLADGMRLTPYVIVAATGYRPNLEPLLGHLGVLDRDGAPPPRVPRPFPRRRALLHRLHEPDQRQPARDRR
jgi:hypothetical protein